MSPKNDPINISIRNNNDERGIYRIILKYSLYQSYKNPENMGIFWGSLLPLFCLFFRSPKITLDYSVFYIENWKNIG
jgi:hypothetical protein